MITRRNFFKVAATTALGAFAIGATGCSSESKSEPRVDLKSYSNYMNGSVFVFSKNGEQQMIGVYDWLKSLQDDPRNWEAKYVTAKPTIVFVGETTICRSSGKPAYIFCKYRTGQILLYCDQETVSSKKITKGDKIVICAKVRKFPEDSTIILEPTAIANASKSIF